ncbi:Vta1 like-domain-containing protein [Gloeopeniophorella convolvens]|nr:Vta1 like-domain-containing protein [Gloeopeniophorella convolvens]
MSYLGLPPVPPDLKPITSYLQRAQETKTQDPVISYWCTYYAAQVGISLKAVSPPNREFLGALLTALENLRATVGTSDAITVENASSAYVENFALKVFASADNEDRRGTATRKTAKKFLAAATFFEILNVFEDRGPWEAVSASCFVAIDWKQSFDHVPF